jgi:hypothetical protein
MVAGLKIAAIVFAGVSPISLTLAAVAWLRSAEPPRRHSERDGTAGGLILFSVSLALVGGLWMLTESFGWERDRTFWVGCGAFLTLMTLTRPWWFWDNYKARWLGRNV